MNMFLHTALTFPTLPYSVLLTVCVIYWALAATGLADGDSVDDFFGADGDGADLHSVAGLFARLGLGGLPVMLVLTVLVYFAWMGSYFTQLLLLRHLPDALRLPLGVVTLVAALVPGVLVTSLLLRPLRRLLLKLRPPVERPVLGRTAIVSTSTVGHDFGLATMDDGGAGLILQVRCAEPDRFGRGDRVVPIEYLEAQNAYRIVSERQFQTL